MNTFGKVLGGIIALTAVAAGAAVAVVVLDKALHGDGEKEDATLKVSQLSDLIDSAANKVKQLAGAIKNLTGQLKDEITDSLSSDEMSGWFNEDIDDDDIDDVDEEPSEDQV